MAYKSKNLAKIKLGTDREIHIRQIWVKGNELISIRDFIPSTGKDGRGITFPASALPRVLEELSEAGRFVRPGNGSPGPGQGSLLEA